MRFKVGDLVTPKLVYDTLTGWTNEKMVIHSKNIRFGGAIRVKSVLSSTSMELEGEVGTYTPDRFELAKSSIIHQILSEI